MNFIAVLLLGLGLSLDSFAVSLSLGFAGRSVSRVQKWRFVTIIGLFHFAMILVGWYMGENISGIVRVYDHWIAFILLVFIGGKMIFEAISDDGDSQNKKSQLCFHRTMIMSLALSIDALIGGFGLGFVEINIVEKTQLTNVVIAALIIGFCAFALSVVGLLIGRKALSGLGKKAEVVGGCILILIGLKVLLEHTL